MSTIEIEDEPKVQMDQWVKIAGPIHMRKDHTKGRVKVELIWVVNHIGVIKNKASKKERMNIKNSGRKVKNKMMKAIIDGNNHQEMVSLILLMNSIKRIKERNNHINNTSDRNMIQDNSNMNQVISKIKIIKETIIQHIKTIIIMHHHLRDNSKITKNHLKIKLNLNIL